MIPVVNLVIGSYSWLVGEKYFHCSDNSEIYTDTKLPPYLASWQVYRVSTEQSEVCVWSGWRM